MSNDKYIHVKRERPVEKEESANSAATVANEAPKHQYHDANGGFLPPGNHNQDQRDGNFSFDTIHGLKLKEVEYKVPPKAERVAKREEFNGVKDENGNVVVEGMRSKFLKMLAAEHADELKEKLGLSDKQIEQMSRGESVKGYNVHHKLALHGGGKNEFSNFILTPLYPHDQWHHDVMDGQLIGIREGESRKIKIPYTDEMIYDPKKFGFTKENQPVQPNYVSNVDPKGYSALYTVEHVIAKRENQQRAALLRQQQQQQEAQEDKAKALPVAQILRNRQRN